MSRDQPLNRRQFAQAAVTLGSATTLASPPMRAEDAAGNAGRQPMPVSVIDTNVSLFHWPFRRLPLDEVDALLAKLRSLGILQAWAGSFEGLLHRDIAGVNRRLAETCRSHSALLPIGSINLQLPDWKEDLRRCIEEHDMPGVRLHPNYHGYRLDDPEFQELVEQASSAGRFVQIAAAMEDVRTQHPLVHVPDVDLLPLSDVMPRVPGATVQVLNARPRQPLLNKLAGVPGVYFDTSRVDGTDGIAQLVQSVSETRVMLGSHAPFLIPEAALIRAHEADLDRDVLDPILRGNAGRMTEQWSR